MTTNQSRPPNRLPLLVAPLVATGSLSILSLPSPLPVPHTSLLLHTDVSRSRRILSETPACLPNPSCSGKPHPHPEDRETESVRLALPPRTPMPLCLPLLPSPSCPALPAHCCRSAPSPCAVCASSPASQPLAALQRGPSLSNSASFTKCLCLGLYPILAGRPHAECPQSVSPPFDLPA